MAKKFDGLQVDGMEDLQRTFKRLQTRYGRGKRPGAIVGYTASYAAAVHENIEMKLKGQPRASGKGVYWGPRGQAKFLEGPARTEARRIGRIAAVTTRKTRSLQNGLITAALFLQRASQKVVPVEFGNLKQSAFTRKD